MALKKFVMAEARPLPVLLILDVSGSMSVDGKIDALNQAVKEMIEEFTKQEDHQAEIHVGIITFGGQARIHQELTPANEITWTPMGATGTTPFGAAIDAAREMIEDEEIIPSRAYRPTIVVVTDGQPTDEGYWETALDNFLTSQRASKAFRFAMGIGDYDRGVLESFLKETEMQVFEATDSTKIAKFFHFVTMSVSTRVMSKSPDSPDTLPDPRFDTDLDGEF